MVLGYTMPMKQALFILVLLLSGCSDSASSGRDAGRDYMVILDAGQDAPLLEAGALDGDVSIFDGGVVDGASDLAGPDAGPDVGPPDMVGWDLSLSPSTVLYAATTTPNSFSLRQVSGAGASKPAGVPGWTGLLDLESIYPAAMEEYLPLSPDKAHRTEEALSGFTGLRLPGSLGTIYYYHRKLAGTSGLMLVGPKALPRVLLEVTGLYSDTLASRVGISGDGKLGAAVEGKSKVHLFHNDGATFSGGKASVEVTSTASSYSSYNAYSLTFAGGYVYCVAKDAAGADHLLRAPADGSSALTPLTLPVSAGKAPVSVGPQPVVSADGKTMALIAGAMSTVTDLYILDLKTAKATNVTKSPSYIVSRGYSFGSMGGQLAISPKGSTAAYVKWISGTPELFVTSTAAGAKPEHLSGTAIFSDSVTALYNLHLPDEENMLFMAGETYYSLDIYHYNVKSKKLLNLSGTGGLSKPFDGWGDFSPQGAWVSPNGKWFYWVGYNYYSSPYSSANIMGVDLTSFKLTWITKGARVATSSDSVAACAKSGAVYWAVEQKPGTYSQEIFTFDQEKGQPAVRVTDMTKGTSAYWFAYHLVLDPSCSRLAWSAGGGYYNRLMFVMDVKNPLKERQLSTTPRYVAPRVRFTPDGLSLIHASGGSPTATTLKAVTIAGSAGAQLDSTAGNVHIFSVY